MPKLLLGAFGVGGALLAGGCGQARQDAHESKGSFNVKVVKAFFPAKQAIAQHTRLVLQVRNTGTHTVPNVAVSIDSFAYTDQYRELATKQRPIWVVEEGPGAIPTRSVQSEGVSPPGGGQTAYVNTWALGPLAPGHTGTFLWRVVPVKAGHYTLHFKVAAGLSGNARAQFAGGALPVGHFPVSIAPRPPPTHVDPETGQVVSGAAAALP